MAAPTPYWLYLLECENGSYYAGIAVDVEQRFISHVLGRGARYTRANPPVRVLAALMYGSRSLALKAEYALKRLPRREKLGFFPPSARTGARISGKTGGSCSP